MPYCQKCGTKIKKGDDFCPSCGKKTKIVKYKSETSGDFSGDSVSRAYMKILTGIIIACCVIGIILFFIIKYSTEISGTLVTAGKVILVLIILALIGTLFGSRKKRRIIIEE